MGGSTNLGHAFVCRYTKFHAAAGMPDEREQAIDAICADAQPGYSRALLQPRYVRLGRYVQLAVHVRRL